MMKMSSIFYVLVFSSILLLHAAQATLEENCKKIAGVTVTYQFCITSLGADPKSKTADLPELGAIAAQLTLAKGTQVQSYIKKALQGISEGDQKLVNALKDCKSDYAEVLPEDVEQAIQGFLSRRYNDANVHLSAVLDTPDDCEDGFNELGATADPQLLKLNGDFKSLTAISLRISAVLLGIGQ